ncbi:MAG: PadR family transcriptional regulator [Herbinix sp.]|nr:PadR family transcriptional regulator [Herbinix sp.]
MATLRYNIVVVTILHYKVGGVMYDKSQLMRGTIEGCILKILNDEVTYGYDIVTKLQGYGFTDVKEGTIYPLLLRLEKKNMIMSEFKVSPLGPARKYYSLTEDGKVLLMEFKECWKEVVKSVNNIMDLGEGVE